MKINKILILSIILLSILTIGAVSAGDSANALTTANDAGGDLSLAGDTDLISDDDDDTGGGDIDDEDDGYDDESDDESDDDGDDDDLDDDDDDSDDDDDEDTGNETFDFEIRTENEIVAVKTTEINITNFPDDLDGYFSIYYDDEYDDYEWASGTITLTKTFDEMGTHTIKVEYSGDTKYAPIEKIKTINITKYTIEPDSFDFRGTEGWLTLNVPSDFEGTFTITINGRTYKVYPDDDIGEYSVKLTGLKFGANPASIYYPGDEEYYELNTTFTLNCIPTIHVPDEEIYYNDNNTVYLYLPGDATGHLDIYKSTYNPDTDEDEWTLVKSEEVKDGYASIPISHILYGNEYMKANYTGNYEVSEVTFDLDVRPSIDIPQYIMTGSDLTITYDVPQTETVNITVYKRITPEDSEYYEDIALKHVESTGKTPITIEGLTDDMYNILIKDQDDFEITSQKVYLINGTDVKLEFDSPLSEKIIPDEYENYFSISLPEYATGIISVYVDGILVEKRPYDPYDKYFSILAEDLAFGKHTLEVRFESDTFSNSSITATFEVVDIIITIPETVIVNDYDLPIANYVRVTLAEGATGWVEVYMDGELFANKTLTDSYYVGVSLMTADIGNHTVKVIYSGDERFKRVTKTGDVSVDYSIRLSASDATYGDEAYIYVDLPDDITTGDLQLLVDGVEYALNNTGYGYDTRISGLAIGNHTASVTYTGDKKYPAKTVTRTFNVLAGITISASNYYWGDEDDSIYINLPADAKGSLALNITDTSTGITTPVEIPLAGGFASYNITQLGLGRYTIEYGYTGSDYQIRGGSYRLTIYPNIEMEPSWRTSPLDSETINVSAPDTPDSFLNVLVIRHTGEFTQDESYDDVEIVETVVNESIPLVGGKASYTLSNLKLGDYDITASYISNGTTLKTERKSLEVIPKITVPSKIYPDNTGNVTVALPSDATGSVTVTIFDENYDEVDSITGNMEGGIAVIILPKLTPDEYTFEVLYNGNYGMTNTRFYDIEVVMNIEIPTYYNLTGPTKIKYDVGDERGKIYLYADDELIRTVNVNSAKGEIEIPDKYTDALRYYTVTFESDDGYEYTTGEYILKKTRTSPNMEVIVNTPIVGSSLVVNVTLAKRATGTVNAIINSKTYNATVENGNAEITIDGLGVGEYPLTVTYLGDDDFETAEENMTAYVTETERITPQITITASSEIKEENPLSVEVAVANATGSVIINGKTFTLTNGIAKTTLTNLKLGENTITVIYSGDSRYSNATKTKKVTVTEKMDAGLKVNVTSVKLRENAVVTVEIDAAATGEVTVDGEKVTIKNGKGTYTILQPRPGSHTVTVEYAGDANYKSCEVTGEFEVSKLTPEIIISCRDDVRQGENLTIEVTVVNASGSVTINGEIHTLVNSKASTTFTDMLAGYAVFNVAYSGDAVYAAATQTKTVHVLDPSDANLKVSVSNITACEDAIVSIQIDSRATGNVTVNGEAVTMTDGKGTYTISKPEAGNYTIDVTFTGDGLFNPAQKYASFEVSKATSSMNVTTTTSKTPTFTVTLPKDATGTVTVLINGVPFTGNVANGTATVKVTGLKVGTYEATVTYSGDGKYTGASKTVTATVLTDAKISASNKAVYYNAGTKYSVTVYGTNGKVASGVYVTFKVAGKKVAKVKTNKKGVASFKVTQLPKAYKVTATALGKTVTKKLTVKQVLTLKTAVVKKSAKKLVLQATLKKGKTPIKGKVVKFKFNGKTYNAKTNKKGVAQVTINSGVLKKLKVGKKLTYQATYVKDIVKKTTKVKK